MQPVRDPGASDLFNQGLNDSIDEANANVTHADFVAGVRNRSMGFKNMSGEDLVELATRDRKTRFGMLVMLYAVLPSILVPIWAYLEGRWWLLLGIVVSAIGSRVAAAWIFYRQIQDALGWLLFVVFIGSLVVLGIHNLFVFCALSAVWGFAWFVCTHRAEQRYALQSLVESPERFDEAIAEHKIMIFRPGQPEPD